MRLVLTAILFCALSGCATNPNVEVARITYECGAIPYPTPLLLQTVHPMNAGDHWEISHQDYLVLRSWVIDIERYLDDVRSLTKWVNSCFADTRTLAAPEPEKRAWWKFWSK